MRCPIEQGEQFYVALKKLKKEVEMARFPGSNHELSRSAKPVLRVARLNQILRWMDGHIAKNPGDYDRVGVVSQETIKEVSHQC